jgi:pimeloyl-ACP methyl ester carboxylesterase
MAADITITGAGGEYMETVTVVAWHVEPGARVKAGDLLVTVETAKSATEIESPIDGTLVAVNAKVGDEVAVGASLGQIGEEAADASPADSEPAAAHAPAEVPPTTDIAERAGGQRVIASPLARRVAQQLGVDLRRVAGTGPGKRIKRRDVESAARTEPAPATSVSRHTACPIVMLHGIGASAAIWLPVMAGLDPAFVVERFELPGHGRAPALDHPSFEALVEAIREQFAAAGIGEAHLVGHSLGGALALALADTGRLRVRSVSLMAPAGLGPEIDGAFLLGFARATKPESLAPWLARLVADPAALPDGFTEETLRMRSQPGVREAHEQLFEALFPDGTQSFDLRPALQRLRVPARVIWGRRDAIIPWRHALAAPGHVGLHLLAEAGHLPQLEAPDVISRLIAEAVRSAG